jgi:hypothetical protein
MNNVHDTELGVIPEAVDDYDELDDEGLNGGAEESCCPSWVPWAGFGLFSILTLVFIIMYAVAKSEAKDLQRTAPGLINQAIKQPEQVSFKYMTDDALAADGIDYILKANTKMTELKRIGSASFDPDKKEFELHVDNEDAHKDESLKSLFTPEYKAAYVRSALHNFAVTVKGLKKENAKNLTVAIEFMGKDISQVIYEFFEENKEVKEMINKVIIYKKIYTDVPSGDLSAVLNAANALNRATEKKGEQDNFDELAKNDILEKMEAVVACYVDVAEAKAYRELEKKLAEAKTKLTKLGAAVEQKEKDAAEEAVKEAQKAVDEKKAALVKQLGENTGKADDFKNKLDKATEDLSKAEKALKDEHKKPAPESDKTKKPEPAAEK